MWKRHKRRVAVMRSANKRSPRFSAFSSAPTGYAFNTIGSQCRKRATSNASSPACCSGAGRRSRGHCNQRRTP
eukprot:852660-Rhodomonas_salina.2